MENEEEAQKHKKNAKKEVSDHLGTIQGRSRDDPRIDFAAGRPQGPPSRARGILDKSSNERIKESIR